MIAQGLVKKTEDVPLSLALSSESASCSVSFVQRNIFLRTMSYDTNGSRPQRRWSGGPTPAFDRVVHFAYV